VIRSRSKWTARAVVDRLFTLGGFLWLATATAVLVETLLQRGGAVDLKEAQLAVDRLATVSTDSGLLHDIWLLRMRALLAAPIAMRPPTVTSATATVAVRHRARQGLGTIRTLAACGPFWASCIR
jgi:hypothetical protein